MNADEDKINLISEKIIGCAYRVANKLGYGFLEKVYENALAHELRKTGLFIDRPMPELPGGYGSALMPSDQFRKASGCKTIRKYEKSIILSYLCASAFICG